MPEAFPARVRRAPRRRVQASVAILWEGSRFLVQRRPEEGFLGGLWELPGGKWERGEDGEAALRRELREEAGVEVEVLAERGPIRHSYTHFDVTLHPFECRAAAGQVLSLKEPFRWIAPQEIPSLAFPSGTLKVFRAILGPGSLAAEDRGEYDVGKGPPRIRD